MTKPIEQHRPFRTNANRGDVRRRVVAAIIGAGRQGANAQDVIKALPDLHEHYVGHAIKNAAAAGEIINTRRAPGHYGKGAFAVYVHRDFAPDAAGAQPAPKATATSAPEPLTYITPGPTIGRRYDPAAASTHYTAPELAPQQNRPAGNDFLRHPSRHGRHLAWRDGRTALIGEASANTHTTTSATTTGT